MMSLRPGLSGTVLACLLACSGQAGAATFEARVEGPGGQLVADAAVVLEPLAPARPRARPSAHATIEQRGTEFIPWMTVVQRCL